ncbi:MAG: hypothetical protein AAF497_16550, partial [Planctomycetota bacterium]
GISAPERASVYLAFLLPQFGFGSLIAIRRRSSRRTVRSYRRQTVVVNPAVWRPQLRCYGCEFKVDLIAYGSLSDCVTDRTPNFDEITQFQSVNKD